MTIRNGHSFVLLFANLGGNLGDLLILEMTVAWLGTTFPGCQVGISPLSDRRSDLLERELRRKYDHVHFLPSFGVTSRPRFRWFSRRWQRVGVRLATPLLYNWLLTTARRSPLVKEFARADAVFGVGGGHWAGLEKPLNMLALIDVASARCNKVVLLPHSLPQAVSPELRRLMPRALGEVATVFLRDPLSLRTSADIDLPQTRLLPDTAFLAMPKICTKQSPGNPPTIALSLRANTAGLHETGWDHFAGVIAMLHGEGCVLHSLTTHEREDLTISRSCEAIRSTPVSCIEEVFSALSNADVVIGDRLHVLIMATLVGTPIIPILSLPKVRGYVEYLRWPVSVLSFAALSWQHHIVPLLRDWRSHRESLIAFADSARRDLRRDLAAALDGESSSA